MACAMGWVLSAPTGARLQSGYEVQSEKLAVGDYLAAAAFGLEVAVCRGGPDTAGGCLPGPAPREECLVGASENKNDEPWRARRWLSE